MMTKTETKLKGRYKINVSWKYNYWAFGVQCIFCPFWFGFQLFKFRLVIYKQETLHIDKIEPGESVKVPTRITPDGRVTFERA